MSPLEQPIDTNQVALEEKRKAKELQKQAKITEKRVGRFMFQMLEDLRRRLRTKKERQVISQEEQRLRLRNKWARLVWRDPIW